MATKVFVVFRKLARMGSFASCWRYSNVTPLSKSGSPSLIPGEYRPITIIPVLSKVFEGLLANHLHVLKLMILFFGFNLVFIKVWSVVITSAVQKSLDIGYEVRMVGLDFGSTFDGDNHGSHIFKLRKMGIGGTFLDIIIKFFDKKKTEGGC